MLQAESFFSDANEKNLFGAKNNQRALQEIARRLEESGHSFSDSLFNAHTLQHEQEEQTAHGEYSSTPSRDEQDDGAAEKDEISSRSVRLEHTAFSRSYSDDDYEEKTEHSVRDQLDSLRFSSSIIPAAEIDRNLTMTTFDRTSEHMTNVDTSDIDSRPTIRLDRTTESGINKIYSRLERLVLDRSKVRRRRREV